MITKTSIKKPFTVIVMIVIIAIIGGIAVVNTPLDLFPQMDLPYMLVATMVPGASAEEVESGVTTPLEESISQINNVKKVTSISTENVSVIIMEMTSEADMVKITQDVSSSISSSKGSFPQLAMEPMVMQVDANMMPIMTVAISKKGQSIEQSSDELDKIADKIKSVGGVSSVSKTGAIENNVFMQVNAEKMLDKPSNLLVNHLSYFFNHSTMPESFKKYVENTSIGNFKLSLLIEMIKTDPSTVTTMLDAVLGGGLGGMLGDYKEMFTSAFSSMLTPDIISALLTAHNFEMPAGTTMVNGTDFYIKIGDKVKDFESFKHLPAFSLNLKEFDFSTNEEGSVGSDASAYDMIVSLINNFMKPELSEAEMNAILAGMSGIDESMKPVVESAFKELLYSENEGVYTRNEEVYEYLLSIIEQPITIELTDIAYIYEMNTASTMHTIINGADGMMLSVYKSPTSSTTDVTKGVEKLLKEMGEEDAEFNYIILNNQGDLIEYMIMSIVQNLLLGALFAILVLLLFLRDWKPTLTVGMSIIISLVTAFALMYLCGVTLNLVSMGGLALSVGMLVDNSIVVIENIYRKRNEGVSPIKAAYEGTKQVAGAILSSTITTVIVFLPIIFIEGIARDIFMDLALTIGFSLFASLIVAISFVPMISSRMLKSDKVKKESKILVKMKKAYSKSLNFMLNRKWISIVLVLVLFATSILCVFFMDVEFMPTTTTEGITVTASIDKTKAEGYSYDEILNDVITTMDEEFRKKEYVGDMGIELSSGIGMGGFSFGGGAINAYVTLKEKAKIKSDKAKDELEDIVDNIAKNYPEGAVVVGSGNVSSQVDIEGMVGSYMDSSQYGINIYGSDINSMRETALKLEEKLKEIAPDSIKVNNGLINQSNEFKLVVDKFKASKYNLTTAQIYLAYYQATMPKSANASVNFVNGSGSNSVYIYASDYSMTRWYRAKDSEGNWHRMYFDMNDATYTATRFRLDDPTEGEFVKLDRNKGEFTLEENSETVFTVDKVNNSPVMPVYYDNSKINDVDMLTFMLSVPKMGEMPDGDMSDMMPMAEESNEKKVIPMFELLKAESFETDGAGNIKYRNVSEYPLSDAMKEYYDVDENGYWIYKETGNMVPAAVKVVTGYNTISHEEGRRVIQMSVKCSDMSGKKLEKAIKAVLAEYEENNATEGVDIEYIGTSEIISDTLSSLVLMLVLAVVFIYLVMVAQFQSLKSPFIIMFTIPLALTGSILMLAMTGYPISVFALLGIILLVGVVVNNGIVYVDYVNKLMASGMSKREALLRTAEDRIRPILMTALTTICAMLISVFDMSSGAAAIKPMAITVVGGLTYATLLTLYFVPIMYDIMNRKDKKEVIKFEDDKEDDIESEMRLKKIKEIKETLEESRTLALMDESYIEENVPKSTPIEDMLDKIDEGEEIQDVEEESVSSEEITASSELQSDASDVKEETDSATDETANDGESNR